ncbi:protein zer-1 homolog isoform X2 [Nomia melanderi]|uniref:protein zer-1 homolog isoform X2 n=1 Tax=Nomia melanderi TaxID=2448451 RepID=UPI0013040557|nr:protein zer-1 homolog isoform X2 [Nomia melanderi]
MQSGIQEQRHYVSQVKCQNSKMADIDDFSRLDEFVGSETLTELCFKVICKNLDIISVKEEGENEDALRTLRKGLILPSEICNKLVEYVLRNETVEFHDEFFNIFRDTSRTKLKCVKVVGSNMTDHSAQILASHKLVELELVDCPRVTERIIEYINDNAENLQSLTYRGIYLHLIIPNFFEYQKRGYVFKIPNLRSLALQFVETRMPRHASLLAGMPNLTHLDLSNNIIDSFEFCSLFPNLRSLILYNVRINRQTKAFIESIGCLTNLRHLDISQWNPTYGKFDNPITLEYIVYSLPQLTSLDISGTNLAGVHKKDYEEKALKNSSCFEVDDTSNNELCDIPGLASRVNRPLQFLGLYATENGACRRQNIPAKLIAGDANEDQILVAANVCMNNKPGLLLKVLNDLYHVYRYENCRRMDQGLCVILDAMEKHLEEKYIQISGSATLFYVVKIFIVHRKNEIEPRLKERIVRILLAAMNTYKDEETMMRNGCLTLSQFRIPQDVMSNYETLVKLLLHSAKHAQQEGYVQRIGIFLLNSLACQVTGREKRLLGNLGCIKTMLELIEYRIKFNIFDDVLEVAWSTMWNMTDETPINCERFFYENGMKFFHECVKKYRNREELLKNMMGLLGNVAEVQHLRVHLAQQQNISFFANLLHSDSEGIEIPYNAAGILAHIASDGVKAWTVTRPSRDEVLEHMVEAIQQWDIRTGRNINYRSFLPLLRLLDVYHTPQCQHWAVWALANLTTVYPHKYCTLVIEEGGIEKLNTVISDPRPYESIKELAHSVIDNCCHYIRSTNK